MRRIRYQVACSLDGYIAGPNGEYDWIVMGPEIDFQALTAQSDTFLMGRKTFEVLPAPGVRCRLALRNRRVYERSGIVLLKYGVAPGGVP